MADIAPTIETTDHYIRATWDNVTNADSCVPLQLPRPAQGFGALQVSATIASATVNLKASGNGATPYFSVREYNGNVIARTSTGGNHFMAVASHLQPVAGGGTGSQALTFAVYVPLVPARAY